MSTCLDSIPEKRPAQWLHTAALRLGRRITSIAEIGVYKGAGSLMFRKLWPKAELFLIDPWEPQEAHGKIYRRNPYREKWDGIYAYVCRSWMADPMVHIFRCDSATGATIVPGNLDLIYIDGMHTYNAVVQDIEAWKPLLADGGMLCGHDYNLRGIHKGVGQAVNDVLGEKSVYVGADKTWLWIGNQDVR